MVDQSFLDILVCPATKQSLRLADQALLDDLNGRIQAGSVKNKRGDVVSEALEAGLVREDGAVLYAVRDGIPIMLIDESIPLSQ